MLLVSQAGVNPQADIGPADATEHGAERSRTSPAWLDAGWYRQPPMPPALPLQQQISPYLLVHHPNLHRQSEHEGDLPATVHELARISPRARGRYGVSSREWAQRWHAQ